MLRQYLMIRLRGVVRVVSYPRAGGGRAFQDVGSRLPSRRDAAQQRHVSRGAVRARLQYGQDARRQMQFINALGLEPSVQE